MTRTGGLLMASAMTLLAVGQASAQPVVQDRVFGVSKMAATMLAQGIAQSPTIRRLVDQLNQSDVFVRVHVRMGLPDLGQTRLAAIGENDRIVDVVIDLQQSPWRRLELLGHELQHASEIAAATDVRDHAALRARLLNIGLQRTDRTFETDAAQRIEILVRRELARR